MKKSTIIKAALVAAKIGLRHARHISERNLVKNNAVVADPRNTEEVRDVMKSVMDRSNSIDLTDGCVDLGLTLGVIGYGYYTDREEMPKWKQNTYIGLSAAAVATLLIPVIGYRVAKIPVYTYDLPENVDPIVNLYMSTIFNDHGLHTKIRLVQSVALGLISTAAIVVGEL